MQLAGKRCRERIANRTVWIPVGVLAFILVCCGPIKGVSSPDSVSYEVITSNQWDASNYARQRYRVVISALKGYGGKIYYMGSDKAYDFFEIENEDGFFRVNRGEVKIPERFNVGDQPRRLMPMDSFPYP
jgi:hypothetical protein